jgi:hypothetical protein
MQLGSGSVGRVSGSAIVAATVFVASVAIAAFAVLMYEAWWGLTAIPFGILVVGFQREGLDLAVVLAMAAFIAGSLLAIGFGLFLILASQEALSAACDPDATCTSGTAAFTAAGFVLLAFGIVGLILTTRWNRGRARSRRATRSPSPSDIRER